MILWWHWVVIGSFLLITDIFLLNIYYLLWFGLGAFTIALMTAIVPDMPTWVQLLIFGALSSAFLAQWLFFLRPRQDAKAMAEAKKDIPGQIGVVINFHNGEGKIRLQKPIGRRDVWKFRTSEIIKPGDSILVDILGDEGYVTIKKGELI